MNVCGVLVHAIPSKATAVATALNAMPGVEVHDIADGGRIVTTVEDVDAVLALDTLGQMHRLDGVVAAALVYHQFEPDVSIADAAA